MADTISYPPVTAQSLNIPTMATDTPPGVSDVGTAGAVVNQFTGPQHTHASKARKQRVTGVNTATYAWNFPTAFGVGIIPICNGIAEDPADSAADSYNVQIVGIPTNVGCVFRIKRTSVVLGVLGLNNTPGTINIHCSALEP